MKTFSARRARAASTPAIAVFLAFSYSYAAAQAADVASAALIAADARTGEEPVRASKALIGRS